MSPTYAVQQMPMAPPLVLRWLRRIIIGIVIDGYINGSSIGHITVIFFLQCPTIVFKVIENVQRPMFFVFDQTGTRVFRTQQRTKSVSGINFVLPHFGPSTDGYDTIIGKATQKGTGRGQVVMRKASKGLVW
eukprot:scaffold3665_cov214-Amphora_coffeaeformis.AAC.3